MLPSANDVVDNGLYMLRRDSYAYAYVYAYADDYAYRDCTAFAADWLCISALTLTLSMQ